MQYIQLFKVRNFIHIADNNVILYELHHDIFNIEIACVAKHLNFAQRYVNVYLRIKFSIQHALHSENPPIRIPGNRLIMHYISVGARGGTVGCGTALQARRSLV